MKKSSSFVAICALLALCGCQEKAEQPPSAARAERKQPARPAGNPVNADPFWKGLEHIASKMKDPLAERATWEGRDVYYHRTALTPGVLLRMRSSTIRFFSGLDEYGAEPPTFFVVKTRTGAKAFGRDRAVSGEEMAASWIVASFQGSKGYEQFDAPWFLSLQKRPNKIMLTKEGLRIEFPGRDTGHIYSMPLYGYYKPPQKGNDLAAKHNLPSKRIHTWEWRTRVPSKVVERCDWWASVSKAYPVGFQESFTVNPKKDEITFRQDYRWLMLKDDWNTTPRRFAALPPTLALAWKFPGFPMKISAPVHDPDYFTAFGPVAGALDVDRLDITMQVLQYTNELEHLELPEELDADQKRAHDLIARGMKEKFRDPWRYFYDHGDRSNFCWNIVGDVWYPRGLEFVEGDLKETAKSSLRVYFGNEVLRRYSPHHGMYILHGPGIGSWGGTGDAGKFSTNALQAIWAYGQYTGDWDLIKERWGLIEKYFITPEDANWVFVGRGGIAELGDEAPPCSSYARMGWAVKDYDAYLLGCYMFAKELVHHYVKQVGGRYYYEHQPYSEFGAMPPHIYLTDIWGDTQGWQVDGPIWGREYSREHQSANRWVRFHDPDTGRFYRDHLADEVRKELDWYTKAGRENLKGLYRTKTYQGWVKNDSPHGSNGLARLRSFLLGEPYGELRRVVDMDSYKSLRSGAKVALGYSYLRTMVPIRHERLVPKDIGPTPPILGFQRKGLWGFLTIAQRLWGSIRLHPSWGRWAMPKMQKGQRFRSFGYIEGDFGKKVAGREGSLLTGYGCHVHWADAIQPRELADAQAVLNEQDMAPVSVIGPFSNRTDSEITEKAYPPEKEIKLGASYEGVHGPVSWKQTKLGRNRTLDMKKELLKEGQSSWMVLGYLLQYVWSPGEQEAYLLVGHQGGAQAWVNDERVVSHHGRHGRYKADAVSGLCRLRKGWNRVLVKISSPGRRWSAQFRIVHLDRQPIPGLKFSAAPPR